MGPLPLALLFGANIGLGALKAKQAAKQRQQEADIRAAEIEASPWTGKAPTTQVSTAAPNAWAEMAGGAINAAGQAAALENAGLFKASDVSGAATGSLDPNVAVGGQQTVFGNIGAEGLTDASKEGVNYFNTPLSSVSWNQMVPKGSAGLMGRR